jgi:hypothetical protein
VPYGDYMQVHQEVEGERCLVPTVVYMSTEAELDLTCDRLRGHAGKHAADIVPLGKDGVTPFGFVTTIEWDQ